MKVKPIYEKTFEEFLYERRQILDRPVGSIATLTIDGILVSDLESELSDALKKGLLIDWESYRQLEHMGSSHPAYQRVIDLSLQSGIFSLEQDGNIALRNTDPTTNQAVANPRHYAIRDVGTGNKPMFFRNNRDALEYIRAGEELHYMGKGFQAQRIHVIT